MTSAISRRKYGCHLSCPGDLFGFSAKSLSLTSSGVMRIEYTTSLIDDTGAGGMLLRSSTVKTLAKKLLSVSAFSGADVAADPSGLVKVEIRSLVFNRDLA